MKRKRLCHGWQVEERHEEQFRSRHAAMQARHAANDMAMSASSHWYQKIRQRYMASLFVTVLPKMFTVVPVGSTSAVVRLS